MKTMIRNMMLTALLAVSVPALGAGGGDLPSAGVNVNDIASLQRGAKLYVNYCMGCHSLDYMRYNRLAEDLQLGEEMVMKNLMFTDAKIGETMSIAMTPEDGEKWFGKAPPDLSLIGRSRRADWIYAYMLGFYKDETGKWNNTVLKNASMPHVLWQLQGIQKPIFKAVEENGVETLMIESLAIETPGQMSPEEYKQVAKDLATFLDYAGEPAKLKRKNIGVWVMLYLSIFAFIAYLLKAEFWRDVH